MKESTVPGIFQAIKIYLKKLVEFILSRWCSRMLFYAFIVRTPQGKPSVKTIKTLKFGFKRRLHKGQASIVKRFNEADFSSVSLSSELLVCVSTSPSISLKLNLSFFITTSLILRRRELKMFSPLPRRVLPIYKLFTLQEAAKESHEICFPLHGLFRVSLVSSEHHCEPLAMHQSTCSANFPAVIIRFFRVTSRWRQFLNMTWGRWLLAAVGNSCTHCEAK